MSPVAARLSGGKRLHLQHGPIDLIIGADGDRDEAFSAAEARFMTVLEELVDELPALRQPLSASSKAPAGETAQRMHRASLAFNGNGYLTRMAAVAGAVADTILVALTNEADIRRAYVNNGGDIALHLAEGQRFTTAMQGYDGRDLGRITIRHEDPIRGITTSGRHGRSFSLGVADSVTVLATTAAEADVAATLIANAVDLPGHHAVSRAPARSIRDDSDLGWLPVVTGCAPLSFEDRQTALRAGAERARAFNENGLIAGAAMFLQGDALMVGCAELTPRRLDCV